MKNLKKVLLRLVAALVLLIVTVLVQQVDPMQYDTQTDVYVFPDSLALLTFNQDSLREVVGSNKGLPKGFEIAALLAYAAYPQLKNVEIEMQLVPSGAPMESNFDLITLLGSGKNRKYIIYLNNAPDTPFDEILLRSLPFDSQVGILAHELGHVAYYHRLSTLEIAKWGLMYLISDDFRAKHERSTDLMPVFHGLGSQIYQYAWHVRNDPSCKELFESFGTSFIDKFYMSDKELAKAIRDHKLYKSSNL
ncbi:MAG: hypothetical protein ABJP45_05250 [Cyclobacteriaceae bacterium]